eukprot:CAMPEP_0180181952 /NCGR_PEP_ID=MMETSP0986-20121125/40396_1 /TAXON_ID=697907 /ORGANISM="non described non described, Strain CCMP2293" /LENGTH=1599 /DNA_ID=CAMNT_0022135267 /DNA_START=88 /DNA_END=4888 /DNA_ORIENTATION=+
MNTAEHPRSGPGSRVDSDAAMDAVVVNRVREIGGIFGIGLKVAREKPFVVQRATDLQDLTGTSIDRVSIDDELLLIDGQDLVDEDIDHVENMILGVGGSSVKLTFKNPDAPEPFSVEVLRHVPIRTWNEEHRWAAVREDLQQEPLLAADATLVTELEAVRLLLIDPQSYARDLLKGASHGRRAQREAAAGDVIESVDGQAVDSEALSRALRAIDVLGSTTTFSIRRGGLKVEVGLARTSANLLRRFEGLLNLAGTVHAQASKAPKGGGADLAATAKALEQGLVEYERVRAAAEADQAARLFGVQEGVEGHVARAMGMLHPLPHAAAPLERSLEENIRAEVLRAEKRELSEANQTLMDRVRELEQAEMILKSSLEHVVPVQDHKAALSELDTARSAVEAMMSAMGMKADDRVSIAEADAAQFREEVARLKEQMSGYVPKGEVVLAKEAAARARGEVERYRQQVAGMAHKDELETARDEAKTLAKEVARLEALRESMVLRVEAEALGDEVKRLQAALKRAQDVAAKMVSEESLAAAQKELKVAAEDADARKKELDALQTQIRGLEAKLFESVPLSLERTASAAATAFEVRLVQADAARVRAEKSEAALQEDLRAAQAEAATLKQKMAQMATRPELHNLMADRDSKSEEIAALRQDLEAAKRADRALEDKVASLENDLDALRALQDELVPRKELLAARAKMVGAEAKAEESAREGQRKEVEILRLQALAKQTQANLDDCLATEAERVPRKELSVALHTSKLLVEEGEVMHRQLLERAAQVEYSASQATKAKQDLEAVREQMAGMVAGDEHRSLETRFDQVKHTAEAEAADALALRKLISEQDAEGRKRTGEIESLKTKLSDMMPQKDFLWALAASEKAAREAAEAKAVADVAKRENAAARETIAAVQKQVASQRSQISVMVAREEFLKEASENRDLRHDALGMDQERTGLKSEIESLWNQVRTMGDEAAVREAQIADLVPAAESQRLRRDLNKQVAAMVETEARSDALADGVKVLKVEAAASVALAALKSQIAEMVPRQEAMASAAASRQAETDVATAKTLLDEERGISVALRTQLASTSDALGESEAARADMLPYGDITASQAQAKAAQFEAATLTRVNEALTAQLDALKGRLEGMVTPDKVLTEEAKGDVLRRQLQALQSQLAEAGLSSDRDLFAVLTALSGSSPQPAAALLAAAKGLPLEEAARLLTRLQDAAPRRSPADVLLILDAIHPQQTAAVLALLEAASAPRPLSARDIAQIQGALAGPVELSVEQLAGMPERVAEMLGRACPDPEIHAEIEVLKGQLAHLTSFHKAKAPRFEPGGLEFSASVRVVLRGDSDGDAIYYTLDGSDPSDTHCEAQGVSPVTLVFSETCELKAVTTNKTGTTSEVSTAGYSRLQAAGRLAKSPIAKQQSGRAEAAMKPGSSPNSPLNAGQAGVGMMLRQGNGEEGQESIVVREIMAQGAAAVDGTIAEGDVLVSVDGREVWGMHLAYVSSIIQGRAGSPVTLSLLRSSALLEPYEVNLIRAMPLDEGDRVPRNVSWGRLRAQVRMSTGSRLAAGSNSPQSPQSAHAVSADIGLRVTGPGIYTSRPADGGDASVFIAM